jgi:hydroxyacyl-ACP dehydratase HTD2-like protein with hotdog domain
VQFTQPDLLRLDNRDVALVERITDVRVAGGEGSEKIFVGIERRIGIWVVGESEDTTRKRMTEDVGEINLRSLFSRSWGNTALIERRDLCFLRSDASLPFRADAPRTALKPPSDPAFVYALTPTPALLFRFSALTFNAHAIHIDPEYTRNIYGLPKLLVHGPLCLALMLECLNRAVKGSKRPTIAEINYRNFSPVFVGEELRVCGKMRAAEGQEWEVWIETGAREEATLAVRGTASVTH